MTDGKAWVTLATNDSYALGAVVLANSLKRVSTTGKLVVMVTPGVSAAMRGVLDSTFDVVTEVNVLDSEDAANLALLTRPELGITFTKLHCWRLTEYEKCVFLDADTLVLQNCDELFNREEFSAAPDSGWPDCFNSGVFVFQPNLDTYEKLLQFAIEQGSFDGGDQGLLNLYFSDWSTKDIGRHLPFIYNMVATATYSYLPAYRVFGQNVKIAHFIGPSKPWLQYFDSSTGQVRPEPGQEHLQELLQAWWDIFRKDVHPKLTPEMKGLAGAYAKISFEGSKSCEQIQFEDAMRKNAWEQGRMDYLGKDSFDNIMKKIQASLAQATQDQKTRAKSPSPAKSSPKGRSKSPSPAKSSPSSPQSQATEQQASAPPAPAPVQEQKPTPAAPAPTPVSIPEQEPAPQSEPEQQTILTQVSELLAAAATSVVETASPQVEEPIAVQEAVQKVTSQPETPAAETKTTSAPSEPAEPPKTTPAVQAAAEPTPPTPQVPEPAPVVQKEKSVPPTESQKPNEQPKQQQQKRKSKSPSPPTPAPVAAPVVEKPVEAPVTKAPPQKQQQQQQQQAPPKPKVTEPVAQAPPPAASQPQNLKKQKSAEKSADDLEEEKRALERQAIERKLAEQKLVAEQKLEEEKKRAAESAKVPPPQQTQQPPQQESQQPQAPPRGKAHKQERVSWSVRQDFI